MNHTIQSRIKTILILSLTIIGIIGAVSLYYFSKISSDIDTIIKEDIIIERSAERIRVNLLELKRMERIYLETLRNNDLPIDIAKAINDFEKSIDQLNELSLLPENKERLAEMLKLSQSYREILAKANKPNRMINRSEIKAIDTEFNIVTNKLQALINKILESRYDTLTNRQERIEIITSNADRNMLFLLFMAFIGGIALVILAPSRVTAPFKKYITAIDAISDLKYDVRLPISGNDEVSKLGSAINHLIDRFCTFDEIKRKRIQFEKSKQRVLSNMLDQGVMMVSIEGDILFFNDQLAKILNLNTSDYKEKDYHMVNLPNEIKEMIEEVLKTKERVDSRMFLLNYKLKNESGEMEDKVVEALVDVGLVRNYKGNIVNLVITFEDITNPPGQSVFKRISVMDQTLL